MHKTGCLMVSRFFFCEQDLGTALVEDALSSHLDALHRETMLTMLPDGLRREVKCPR